MGSRKIYLNTDCTLCYDGNEKPDVVEGGEILPLMLGWYLCSLNLPSLSKLYLTVDLRSSGHRYDRHLEVLFLSNQRCQRAKGNFHCFNICSPN